MTELNTTEWLPALEAARRMSARVGFIVTADDIRQLRRYGKIKKTLPINARMVLYNAAEIDHVPPPKKRVHRYQTWDEYLADQRAMLRAKGVHRQDESLPSEGTPLSP